MTITLILLIMAGIVVLGTVLGFVLGLSIDDKSRALGGVAGFLISGQVAVSVGVILAIIHFVAKFW